MFWFLMVFFIMYALLLAGYLIKRSKSKRKR